jgi:K+-sensing histidine kinase KdpD
MVSHRGPQNRLHFGLGLYVVRIIAEYHGGLVRAMNLTDGSGVAIVVQLPLAETPASLSGSHVAVN